jgi:hypothetical protein
MREHPLREDAMPANEVLDLLSRLTPAQKREAIRQIEELLGRAG